jgi:hypothetical protein
MPLFCFSDWAGVEKRSAQSPTKRSEVGADRRGREFLVDEELCSEAT